MDITKRQIVFLPQDRQIMELTGMTPAQYRDFCLYCYKASRDIPSDEPTAFLNFLIPLVIGIALSFAASLLAPKPKANEPQPDQKNEGGQKFVTGNRAAPTSGFDTVQNVVELGSVISLVYANRREIDGIWYGGVRVNTSLLWSQLYSIGGGQLLRAMFSVGEGALPKPNPEQFAIGNNLIRNFDLQENNVSRISLYYVDGSKIDNRIKSYNHIAGRLPGSDLGNAETDGAGDVFQARTASGWAPDFCYVSTPSNQTSFGVSGFIGNNMPFRPNPVVRPTENYDNIPQKEDTQGKADRAETVWKYYGRCGVYAVNNVPTDDGYRVLNVGDRISYKLFKESDNDGVFQYEIPNSNVVDGYAYTSGPANSVASRQNSYDDQIVLGDKYLLGTAQGICVDRTSAPFNSETTNLPVGGGNDVIAIFEVTEPGAIHTWDEAGLNPGLEFYGGGGFVGDSTPAFGPYVNATTHSHILRLTEASFTTERKTRYVEVGIRSRVNLQVSGICFYRGIAKDDVVRNLTEIDYDRVNDNVSFVNGIYTSPETRISGFKVEWRQSAGAAYTELPYIFAVRSMMDTPAYNYLRFEFVNEATYEFKLTPVSGFEMRNSGTIPINILDYKNNNRLAVSSGGVTVIFSGETDFARTGDNFALPPLTTIDGGLLFDNNGPSLDFDDAISGRQYFSDAFARGAEKFMHEELQATTNSPEHEIVYVNTQSSNNQIPEYENLAVVGMNIRSSNEITSLEQFSVYCAQGINSTNSFPEVLLDMFTNKKYGTGKILNERQIDIQSFAEMAQWCNERRYFFDGMIDSKVNIRSWGTDTAKNYLLDLIVRNGRFALQPVADFDRLPTISALFTSGNIIDDTFEYTTADEQERILPRVSVKWREEKRDTQDGLFPVVRQVTVRESATPKDAPLDTIDLSEYCTSQKQAIDVGKWSCRQRRFLTHSISFETTPTEAALDIGAVFKLGMESVAYDQPQNGAIASDGTVTSWPPLADGKYSVLLWNGVSESIQEISLIISNGKANGYQNAVFCLRTGTQKSETYKTQALSYTSDGNINVEASVYPTNDAGFSLLTEGWDDPLNWVIEGEI
jgi:hypothetical protein